MVTTNIVFDYRNRAKKGMPGSVEIRVITDRKTFYISTGIKVLRNEFASGCIINRPDSEVLNRRLALFCVKIGEVINRMIEKGLAFDIEMVRKAIWFYREEYEKTIIEWMKEQIEQMNLKDGTIKHYRCLVYRLQEYGKIKRWDDVTVESVLAFDNWMRKNITIRQSDAESKSNAKKIPISDAGLYNYHKCFKALLNRAVLLDKITINPYNKLRGRFKRGDRATIDFLTEDEMTLIREMKIPSARIATARDLAVIQMYTGMAYADLMKFDMRDYRLENGKWVKAGVRTKTSVLFVNQLLPPVVEVIERYDMQIPHISNQEYNRLLKVIGTMANLRFDLHSHVLRHTYVTWVLRHGVPIEIASRMAGHTDIAMTMRYAKILSQDVCNQFTRLEEFV